MAIREIRMEQDPILRQKSKPVKEITPRIIELLDDMKETMDRKDAVGIAAVQVGVLKRIFLASIDDQFVEILNPEIVDSKGASISIEACLSIKDKVAYVQRPNWIIMKGMNRHGETIEIEARGDLATVMCHEFDHLNGVLFTDRKIAPANEEELNKLKQYGTPA